VVNVKPKRPPNFVAQVVALDGRLALKRITQRGRHPCGHSFVVRHR